MPTPWPVQAYGNSSNPPLVFLHGFLGRASDWNFLIERFSQDYFLILSDLPGHGANLPPLPERPLNFRWLAGGLRQTLRSLGLASAHLVGYSLGGRTALNFAVRYPHSLRSLTLESASPGLPGRRERQQRRQQDDQRAAKILAQGLEPFLAEWYAMPMFASLNTHPGLLEILRRARAANHPRWMARVLADLSPGRQPSLWRRLPELQQPVLLLAGEHDMAYTDLVKQAAGLLPDARLEIAPGAGHNVHLERPDWFIEQVFQFL